MQPIGGYFELELSKGGHRFHDTPYTMKSGRSALQHILLQTKPALVYVPFYTCNALLEPFEQTNTPYRFYELNDELEPARDIDLKEGELLVYVNYLDLKRDKVAMLSEKYKDKLIVDCTQAFFLKGNGVSWFFNSCRKFFGVPDGSYVYVPAGATLPLIATQNDDYIYDHLIMRFNGATSAGYDLFIKNEALAGEGVLAMSRLSEYLLSRVDYTEVAQARKRNFDYLHSCFRNVNNFRCTATDGVPMSYPLLLQQPIDKRVLSGQNIFIPTFWTDVLNRNMEGYAIEKELTTHLLPLPVDHRYGVHDMDVMCNAVKRSL